jgi:tetratricopeptide (TPR) repeat protein
MSNDNLSFGLVSVARAPLEGRDSAMATLDAALEAVERQKKPRIVTIVGPAGIGKSRLVHEFVVRHRGGSSLVPRVYRGSARDTDAAYGIFARLLRMRFGLTESMEQEAAKSIVRQQVTKVTGDRKVGDVLYFLGQFLDLPFEDSPLTRAIGEDPAQARILLSAVFKAFLEADAAHSPMCLVFDDLHAAHGDSLSLLRHLVDGLDGPILILCAARPELLIGAEDWTRAGESRHELVELGALSDDEARRVLTALLEPATRGSTGLEALEPLVDRALQFAGGNPSLLEQMVRIYHDTGVLEEETVLADQPRWSVHLEELESAELPLTIEDAIDARLASLEKEERRLLEYAATMGSVFWTSALVSLWRIGQEPPELWTIEPRADAEPGAASGKISAPSAATPPLDEPSSLLDAPSSLHEPQGAALVDERAESPELKHIRALLADLETRDYVLRLPDSTFPGSDEYAFKHNKERETIRSRIAPTVLRRLHGLLADWLDHHAHTRTSEEFVAMLADHRERAGDALAAGLAYVEAGDLARAHYASTTASLHYERGLGLLGDGHVGRRIDALHNHGDVLLLGGRIDDALAAFREMLELAWRLDRKSKGGAAHNRIGRLYRDTGQLDEAGRHLEAAMALFRAAGDERGVASSYDDLGKLAWLRGDYAASLGLLREGLARRRRLGDRRGIALSLNNLGIVLHETGDFGQAIEDFEQALQIRREIGDLVGVIQTLNNLGTLSQDRREFERALSIFREALEVARQIGDKNRIALVLANVGETHHRAGNPAEAIRVLEQAEEQFDELGDQLGLAEAKRVLGNAYLAQGDLVRARECISRSVDLFAELRSRVHLGVALRTLGDITAAGGWGASHTRSAREYYARSARIFEEIGNELELARTFKVYAAFLRAEPELGADPQNLAEATRMEAKADGIFARLDVGGDAPPREAAAPA